MADDDLTFSPSSPMVTTPPAEASDFDAPPPRPINTTAITEARSRADEAMDRFQHSSEQEAGIGREKERALEPFRERYISQVEQPLPQRPRQTQTPSAPKRNEPGADENWLMAAGLLGALAGAFTRRHQTNALAAFTGAIEGYHEGSKEKFEQNMKIWEAEHKRAVETNQQAMDEYRAVLEDRKLSAEQRRIEFLLVAQKYDDRAAMTAAQTKNDLVVAQYYDKRAQAAQQMEMQGARLQQQWEQFDRRQKQQLAIVQMRALGVTDPQKQENLIRGIANYEIAPISGIRGSMIMEEVKKLNPDYNQNEWNRRRSMSVAEGGTYGRSKANIDLLLDSMGPTIEAAGKAALRVPTTAFPDLNKLIQRGAAIVGDPALKTFQLANIELAEKFAATMAPRQAVIPVANMNRAIELVSTADSPEAYEALLTQIASYAERQRDAINRGAAGLPPPEIVIPHGPRRLESTPREFLPPATGGTVGGITGRPGPSLTGQPSQAPTTDWEAAWKRAHPSLPESMTFDLPGWAVRLFQ